MPLILHTIHPGVIQKSTRIFYQLKHVQGEIDAIDGYFLMLWKTLETFLGEWNLSIAIGRDHMIA